MPMVARTIRSSLPGQSKGAEILKLVPRSSRCLLRESMSTEMAPRGASDALEAARAPLPSNSSSARVFA